MHEKSIAGVCAGFARYLDIDVTLTRILWLCIAIFTGVGFIAYLVAWIVMPKDYSHMPAAAPVSDRSAASYGEGASPAHSSQ
jgi:phage shock protein C